MCQIIHSMNGEIPADLSVTIDKELNRNRDGAGAFVVFDKDGATVVNYFFRKKSEGKVVNGWKNGGAIANWLKAQAKKGKIREWAVHARYATHGDKSKTNCHPFTFYRSCAEDDKSAIKGTMWATHGLLMHNGVFSCSPINKSESDTGAFARLCDNAKDTATIERLRKQWGSAARLLVRIDGQERFTRMGSWREDGNIGFSSMPADKRYDTSPSYGHSQYQRTEAQVSSMPALLALTNNAPSTLPDGVLRNQDGAARSKARDILARSHGWTELEKLILIHGAAGADAAGQLMTQYQSTIHEMKRERDIMRQKSAKLGKSVESLNMQVETQRQNMQHLEDWAFGEGREGLAMLVQTLPEGETLASHVEALEAELSFADETISDLRSELQAYRTMWGLRKLPPIKDENDMARAAFLTLIDDRQAAHSHLLEEERDTAPEGRQLALDLEGEEEREAIEDMWEEAEQARQDEWDSIEAEAQAEIDAMADAAADLDETRQLEPITVLDGEPVEAGALLDDDATERIATTGVATAEPENGYIYEVWRNNRWVVVGKAEYDATASNMRVAKERGPVSKR